jgi:hypothetical protein
MQISFKKHLIILWIGATMFLSGCSAKVADYKDTSPNLDIQEYFSGPIKAWGIVQDRGGKVIQRVNIDMVGKWDGDNGTLSETLNYFDGRVEKRIWVLKKVAPNKFIGKADGIIGDAVGESNGMAIRWNYVMTIPVDGKSYDITFDDWMFMMDKNVMVNRSYMSKFGFKVAEISLFMQKQ